MKTILTTIFALFMFCALSTSSIAGEPSNRYEGKNIVIILSSDDDIQAGAGLIMAKMAAMNKANVTVYVAATAVKYATKDSFHRFAPKDTTHREMLEAIIKNGGTVKVCSLCPSWLNLETDDFIEGTSFSGALDVFDAAFAENTLTLTF